MPQNTAAFLTGIAQPLDVKAADYPTPGPNEIIVANRSIALNPYDFALQARGTDLFPWLKYPAIIGKDIAGEVVEVGSSVTRFKVGDRVLGQSEEAFQKYSKVFDYMAAHLPEGTAYQDACVLPLAFTTAINALFRKEHLGLKRPSADSAPKPNGEAVFIYGGSTSVGCNAVQLAAAAGYEVHTTSSPKNFDYMKSLGASYVYDYNSPTIEKDVVAAFSGKKSPGAVAIGHILPRAYQGIVDVCAAVVKATEGRKFVSMVSAPPEKIPDGVETKFALATEVYSDEELGYALYGDYLTRALASGAYKLAPKPEVVGHGLEGIQEGLPKLLAGVSVKKLVVSLE